MHHIDLPRDARRCTSRWYLMHRLLGMPPSEAVHAGREQLVRAHERDVEPFRAQQQHPLSRLIPPSTRKKAAAGRPGPSHRRWASPALPLPRRTLSLPAYQALRSRASIVRTVHGGALFVAACLTDAASAALLRIRLIEDTDVGQSSCPAPSRAPPRATTAAEPARQRQDEAHLLARQGSGPAGPSPITFFTGIYIRHHEL